MLFLSSTETLILAGIALGTWLAHGYIQERRDNPKKLPLPPGPKGYPIIGSLFSYPRYKAWLDYDQWFKIYGDIIYFKVFGQGFLILGSLDRVYDIFERRSSNYADRPRMVMLNELMDWDYVFAFQRYGIRWRRHRRQFHDYFHPNIVHRYYPIQLDTARAFVRDLLDTPEKFTHHIRFAFADTILKIVYGMGARENESFVAHAESTLEGMAAAGNPGAYLVDVIPAMKIIPEWFPGADWKRKANEWAYVNSIVANSLWNIVKERMAMGTAEPCVATQMIESLPDDGSPESKEEEVVRREAAANGFIGGADTTASTLTSFFMAMALHPEVQKKAQAELDRVLCGRLPEFNDRQNLPYINAVIKETGRWQPVAPLAATHMNPNPDEYAGYYIPKNTYIIGNAWTILHDSNLYKDPFAYNPDRFLKDGELDPSVKDPTIATFGFGRRICPGRFFSDGSVFATIATVLAVFDIKPGTDENGKEVEIKPNMSDGLLSYPEPFECRIIPRSREAEELIRNSGLMG